MSTGEEPPRLASRGSIGAIPSREVSPLSVAVRTPEEANSSCSSPDSMTSGGATATRNGGPGLLPIQRAPRTSASSATAVAATFRRRCPSRTAAPCGAEEERGAESGIEGVDARRARAGAVGRSLTVSGLRRGAEDPEAGRRRSRAATTSPAPAAASAGPPVAPARRVGGCRPRPCRGTARGR